MVQHQDAVQDLKSWLDQSHLHFYVKCSTFSKNPSWSSLTKISPSEVPVCHSCHEDENAQIQLLKLFQEQSQSLRALDLFSGTGAFGLALEQSSPLNVTHAVEISPSAADSMRYVRF